jgi:hydrogenase/urease accessory protein HupE
VSILTIVLMVLGMGIVVGLATKKLNMLEFVLVGSFGLMLGTTSVGQAISHGITALFSTVGSWIG